MRKYFILIILFITIFLNFFNISFAQKRVFYYSGDIYESVQTDFSKNYVCNLDELENVATTLMNQKKWGDLVVIYDRCVEKYPEKPFLYNNRAHVYKMLNKYDLALDNYEKAISLDGFYVNPYLGKASLLIFQSKEDEALKILDRVLSFETKEATAYYYKALAFKFKGDKENAFKNYTLSIKYANNTIPIAYFDRGNLFASYKHDYKKAISDYTKCIKIIESESSKDFVYLDSLAKVYYNRSLVYYKLNNKKNSVKDLKTAYILFKQEGNNAMVEELKKLFE